MKNNQKFTSYNWTEFWKERPVVLEKLFSWYESIICLDILRGIEISTCLELGGGPGYMAKIIAKRYHYDLSLIDNNKEAYSCYKKISNYGNYIVGDYFKHKPKEKFDLVFSFGVIEHYPSEKRKELINIHKKLSKKYVLIFVPTDCFLVRNFFHFPEKGYEKLYKKEELRKELEQSGMKLIRFAENIRALGYLCSVN